MNATRSRIAIVVLLCMVAAACSGAKKAEDAAPVEAGVESSTTTEVVSGAPETTAAPVTAPGEAPTTFATSPAAPARRGRTPRTTAAAKSSGKSAGTPSTAAAAQAPSGPDPGLFTGAANTRGITDTEIKICGHAALTYAPAFNTTPDDLNVYYDAINDAGGVYGRKIKATYENDNYEGPVAVQAAEACKAKNPFMILGGIGFDQIPAVRNWAENNKELYFHHIATEKGSEGKKFSFTTQPTVEAVGRAFGQLTVARYKNKKVGVLYRNSEFWQPGFDAFKSVLGAAGMKVLLAVPVEKNQANYTQALVSLKNAGVDFVFGWENTLALTQMVLQAKAQSYSPQWLAFPFNLTSQGLGEDAMTPPMVGLASWPGYSKGDYTGTFASYASDMKEFEAQYARYRPNTDIGGVAGDLLWLNWVEQKRLVALLKACGKDCTRDHIVGMLDNGYRATTSPTCPLDFRGGKRDGSGGLVNVMETYRSPSGKVNWRSTALCKNSF